MRESAAATTGSHESRTQILIAAASLFRANGYAAVSMRDIAGACDRKAGSLYYHFASKDEIVAEVLRVGVQRVYDEVKAAVDACPETATREYVFELAVRTHLRALLELHDFTSANIRIFGQLPESLRAGHIELRHRYEKSWTKLLSRFAKPSKKDRERLRLARFFVIGAMNGTLEWFRPERSSVDEIAGHLADVFLYGLKGRK